MSNENKASVLIVDDDAASRMLLKLGLTKKGYHIVEADCGQNCLDILKTTPVNLIIMDYHMPDMSGIEVTKIIKNNSRLKRIPILFLSGNNERQDKSEAFEAGAMDFIVKPFDLIELNQRVKNHLKLYFMNKKTEKYAFQMEELAKERAKQLLQADRLATLGTLAAGVAHEINNPCAFISGNAQTLRTQFWPIIKPILEKEQEESPNPKLKFILEEMEKVFGGVENGVARINKIVNGLKTFSYHKENKVTEQACIKDCIDNAIMLCGVSLKKGATLDIDMPESLPSLNVDTQEIEQVLINLMVNSVHAMETREEKK